MSNSTTQMPVVRGKSQSFCVASLLLTCCALAAQSEHIVFGILFWFMAPGQMVLAKRRLRHSCQGWLQREHRPRTGDIL